MKLIIAIFLIAAGFIARSQEAKIAESQKIGHADWQLIFNAMPEYKTIQKELESFGSQLKTQLESKAKTLEAKIGEFRSLPAGTPEAILRDKESELTYLQNALQQFEAEAQRTIQEKQNALLKPVLERIGKAIEEVALSEGYSYILNPNVMDGSDILLFAQEKYDISEKVLEKLGVALGR